MLHDVEALRPRRPRWLARAFWYLVLGMGAVVLLFGAYLVWFLGLEHY